MHVIQGKGKEDGKPVGKFKKLREKRSGSHESEDASNEGVRDGAELCKDVKREDKMRQYLGTQEGEGMR